MENLRRQLELFDPAEIRQAMTKAQLRLECEGHLNEIMERYALDRGTVLRIIHQAVTHDVSDLADVLFVVDGIARTVIGETDTWLADAKAVIVGEAPAASLKETVDRMQGAMQTAMSSEMGRVVSSPAI